jgi:hypothetical protein
MRRDGEFIRRLRQLPAEAVRKLCEPEFRALWRGLDGVSSSRSASEQHVRALFRVLLRNTKTFSHSLGQKRPVYELARILQS